jgi:hypothetical protein
MVLTALRYEDLIFNKLSIVIPIPIDAVKLTQTAAAAVVMAAKDLGIETYVKWPNDIVINHKKVCGILTEMNAELTRINYVVVGIGINVNIDEAEFCDEIKDIATSLKIQTKQTVNRQKLTAGILNNFENLYNKFINNNDFKSSIDICNMVFGTDHGRTASDFNPGFVQGIYFRFFRELYNQPAGSEGRMDFISGNSSSKYFLHTCNCNFLGYCNGIFHCNIKGQGSEKMGIKHMA